ncbi:C-C motif chemokine 21-like, partial [Silurus meridionalis]
MRFILFVSVVFFCALYQTLAQGSYDDCCLSYVGEVNVFIKRRVDSYRIQKQDGGCNLSAVVFKLMGGRQLCARPDERWVQNLIRNVKRNKNNPHRRR